jgi:hypothetical protein
VYAVEDFNSPVAFLHEVGPVGVCSVSLVLAALELRGVKRTELIKQERNTDDVLEINKQAYLGHVYNEDQA